MYLPILDGANAEGTASSTELSPGCNLRGTEMILFAEDHDSLRETVRPTLLNLGYCVLAAGNGEETLRLCEKERPALAILDVLMPHRGGPATAAKLLARFPGVPILFTSGYSENSDCPAWQARHPDICKNPIAQRRWGGHRGDFGVRTREITGIVRV